MERTTAESLLVSRGAVELVLLVLVGLLLIGLLAAFVVLARRADREGASSFDQPDERPPVPP